jgi:hypothetical protein
MGGPGAVSLGAARVGAVSRMQSAGAASGRDEGEVRALDGTSKLVHSKWAQGPMLREGCAGGVPAVTRQPSERLHSGAHCCRMS